jgi:hypothetical protein
VNLADNVKALMRASVSLGEDVAAELVIAAVEASLVKRQAQIASELEAIRRNQAREAATERQRRHRQSRTSRVTTVTERDARDEGGCSAPDLDPSSSPLPPEADPDPERAIPVPPRTEPRGDEVRAVFDHYRTHHPKAHPRPRSNMQEWRKIRARLEEGHSVPDLVQAIDGYHRSPFHLGENDRGQPYLGLELIVRDGSHVAKGIELAQQRAGPVMSEREQRGVRAGLSWLERMEGNRDAGP